MTFEEVKNLTDEQTFDAVMEHIKNGKEMIITRENKYPDDDYLNLRTYPEIKVTMHRNHVPWSLEFDCDESTLVEQVPTDFLKTLLMNCE